MTPEPRTLTADEVEALGFDPGLRDGGPDGSGRPWTLADLTHDQRRDLAMYLLGSGR